MGARDCLSAAWIVCSKGTKRSLFKHIEKKKPGEQKEREKGEGRYKHNQMRQGMGAVRNGKNEEQKEDASSKKQHCARGGGLETPASTTTDLLAIEWLTKTAVAINKTLAVVAAVAAASLVGIFPARAPTHPRLICSASPAKPAPEAPEHTHV